MSQLAVVSVVAGVSVVAVVTVVAVVSVVTVVAVIGVVAVYYQNVLKTCIQIFAIKKINLMSYMIKSMKQRKICYNEA